ncbi:HAD family phosphatase [Bacillus sp. DNRA2]|uniref:HAD family hydrolase n=1 Tax=Bacillus sp. DNRA2 TaxID=2723053 RepID=UPI00145E1744|nr:HAD family phosphatase [Bacillus sp. DNRA2]NMD71096.1 HAD family phosphatase [Bacillus sp. DNRA2]
MDKVFIFDMDGVIINSEPMHEEIELAVASELGIKFDRENWEKYVGMRSRDMWESVKIERQLSFDVDNILTLADKRKVQYINTKQIEPINGIKELLETLTELDYRIGLASSSPKPFIEAVLNKFQISKFYDVVVSGDDIKEGKPAPDIYIEAARRLAVSPDVCFVLEDSENGIKAGNAAGMKTIGFKNPASGTLDLSEAAYQVRTIEEVLELI